MNIHTVRDNLKNTIAGKEEMLEKLQESKNVAARKDNPDQLTIGTIGAMAGFLSTNIDELKRILQDVEVCCEQHTEMGWQINPERMGQ
jgi:sigma54-dependent transcription regulator